MHEYSLTIVLFLSFPPPPPLTPPPPPSFFLLPLSPPHCFPKYLPPPPPRGLLGAHFAAVALKEKGHHQLSWYSDQLLEKAEEVGQRLLPAFNTSTGLPYPKVRLHHWPPLPQGHKAIRFPTLITFTCDLCTCDLCTVTRTNAKHVLRVSASS